MPKRSSTSIKEESSPKRPKLIAIFYPVLLPSNTKSFIELPEDNSFFPPDYPYGPRSKYALAALLSSLSPIRGWAKAYNNFIAGTSFNSASVQLWKNPHGEKNKLQSTSSIQFAKLLFTAASGLFIDQNHVELALTEDFSPCFVNRMMPWLRCLSDQVNEVPDLMPFIIDFLHQNSSNPRALILLDMMEFARMRLVRLSLDYVHFFCPGTMIEPLLLEEVIRIKRFFDAFHWENVKFAAFSKKEEFQRLVCGLRISLVSILALFDVDQKEIDELVSTLNPRESKIDIKEAYNELEIDPEATKAFRLSKFADKKCQLLIKDMKAEFLFANGRKPKVI